MKAKPIHIVVMLLVLLFIVQLSPVQAGSAGVSWLPYAEGMALGKSQKKKVFINFFATWCSVCRMMDTKTFKDAAVIDYLNANVRTVQVDVDKEQEVAAHYHIRPLPDMWFVSEQGDPIGNKPGYISPEEMLPVLKFIKTDSYLKMSYQDFLDSLQ